MLLSSTLALPEVVLVQVSEEVRKSVVPVADLIRKRKFKEIAQFDKALAIWLLQGCTERNWWFEALKNELRFFRPFYIIKEIRSGHTFARAYRVFRLPDQARIFCISPGTISTSHRCTTKSIKEYLSKTHFYQITKQGFRYLGQLKYEDVYEDLVRQGYLKI